LLAKMKSSHFILLKKLLSNGVTLLEDKPEETIDATLRALWLLAAGDPVSVEVANSLELPELTETQLDNLMKYIEKRLNGVPLAHITKRKQFMSVELLVGPEALVPRKETELLGYGALELLSKSVVQKGSAKVIDVCTGSGNLALAFAYHQRNAEIYAADLSSEAIDLAKRNMEMLQLNGRVKFLEGDLLQPFDNDTYYLNIDLLTCNPPYISSRKLKSMPEEIIGYEPDLAFDGGPFGINILARLIKEAPKYLAQNGWLAFEVGLGQGEHIYKRLEINNAYKNLESIKNENGYIRVIMAQVNHD
jgi:release factor glutamine methyltransferase